MWCATVGCSFPGHATSFSMGVGACHSRHILQTNEVKLGTGTQKFAAYVCRCGIIGLGTVPKLYINIIVINSINVDMFNDCNNKYKVKTSYSFP